MDYSGLILAALIGLGIAWLWQRGRKKMNFSVKGKHWWVVVIVVVVVLVLIYGGSHTPHTTHP
jgi:predicted CDP-diglyceride synthetase/phosphatidate cytidylyltransferase